MQPIKAVIFDLDGVIVQSERLSWQTWLDFLHEHGKHMGEDGFRQMIGTHDSAEFLRAQFNLPLSAEEIARDHLRRVLLAVDQGVEVTAGIEDLLQDLSNRSLPLAVASNSKREYVLRVLQRTGLQHFFQTVVTPADVAQGKPAPDVYLEAARRIGTPPDACMAVEDSPIGMQAALAAGMHTIAVPNPDLQHLSFTGAHHRFDSILMLHKNITTLLCRQN